MPPQVTLIDVAKVAGVSHTTVSDALNGTGRISADRRMEIKKLAESMQYFPRVAARMMRGNQTGQVGLIICATREDIAPSAIWSSLLASFVRTCETQEIPYHIEFCSPSPEGSFKGPRQFNGQMVDGALVAGFIDNPVGDWLVKQSRYPWVGLAETSDYCVLSDVREGVYEATQHLAALGHRRIAFAYGPTIYQVHKTGLEGFLRGQGDFQLDDRCEEWSHQFGGWGSTSQKPIDIMAWAQQLLDANERPTAFLCNDMRFARAVIYIAMQKGLSIPQDLSVIAYGTATDAQKAFPFLTTIETDYLELTDKALDMLRRRIAGKDLSTQWISVRPRLVMRETVAEAPDRK